ncbi:hypothetical protein HYX16_04320 [Candidatus Woesearchaeota archaeon]|nr:hypothetical protein [Candidatus Woesearchaeota archaeon]
MVGIITQDIVKRTFKSSQVKTGSLEVLALVEELKTEECKENILVRWGRRSDYPLTGYNTIGYSIMKLGKAKKIIEACDSYEARNWEIRVTDCYRKEEKDRLKKKIML